MEDLTRNFWETGDEGAGKGGYVSMKNIPEFQLASIGAPLLWFSEVQSETYEHTYDVNGLLSSYDLFRNLLRKQYFLPPIYL